MKNISSFLWIKGRVRRRVYWLTVLVITAAYIIASSILGAASTLDGVLGKISLAFSGLLMVFVFYLGFVNVIRRLHDLNKSGWEILFLLVPIASIWWAIQIAFFDGYIGENRFGADPKGRVDVEVAARVDIRQMVKEEKEKAKESV